MTSSGRPFSDRVLSLYYLGHHLRLYHFLAAIVLGTALAHLVVNDMWMVAVMLMAMLPGFVVLHKYPLLALFAWLVLGQFLMTTETSALRMIYWLIHRAMPPMTVLVIVSSSMLGLSDRKLAKLSWPELAMLAYLVMTQFSIVYLNPNVLATTYWLYDRVFVPMCLYIIIRLLAPTEDELKQMMPYLLIICAVQTAVGIVSWIVPDALPSMWARRYAGNRAIGTLVNPGVYTDTLTFVSLLLLHAGLNWRGGITRVLYIGAYIAAGYGLFISFTRSSWLGAIITTLGLTVLYPKFMIRLLLVAALVLGGVGGVLLADQLEWASQRFYSEESEESALSRLPIYYAGLRMFAAKPMFGWGYSNFDRYDRQFQGRVGDLVNPVKDHTLHNVYLIILAEQGAVGLLLYVTPFFWWLLLSIRVLPRMQTEGFWSRKLLGVLWLIIAFMVVIANFFNVIVVYALGLWWITLALIATMVHHHLPEQGHLAAVTRERLLHLYYKS